MSDTPSIKSIVVSTIAIFAVIGAILSGICLFWVGLHVFGGDNFVWSWKLILGLLSGVPALFIFIVGVACEWDESQQKTFDKLD